MKTRVREDKPGAPRSVHAVRMFGCTSCRVWDSTESDEHAQPVANRPQCSLRCARRSVLQCSRCGERRFHAERRQAASGRGAMGVKGLSQWLRRRFPAAHVSRLPTYDHVLVDVAPLLYNAARRPGERPSAWLQCPLSSRMHAHFLAGFATRPAPNADKYSVRSCCRGALGRGGRWERRGALAAVKLGWPE